MPVKFKCVTPGVSFPRDCSSTPMGLQFQPLRDWSFIPTGLQFQPLRDWSFIPSGLKSLPQETVPHAQG